MAKITANRHTDQYNPGEHPIAPNRMELKEKMIGEIAVSYTHLTLPTNREV